MEINKFAWQNKPFTIYIPWWLVCRRVIHPEVPIGYAWILNERNFAANSISISNGARIILLPAYVSCIDTTVSQIQFPALNPLFYFCDIILLLLLLFMCLYVHNLLESCLWEDNPTGGRMPFQAGFQSQLPRVPLLPYCCSAFLVFLFLFSLLRQVSNEHPKKLCHLKVP